MEPIYVTGHRNPDTDSIVSAMAYAALRNALGDREFVPARLGHISDETRLVLGRFGFEPPIRIQTMRTQVRDLDYDTPPALSGAVTVSRAWTALQNNRSIPAIPVTKDNGELYGMLSPSEIASYDMRTLSDSRVDRIPVFNLLSVLDGKIINEQVVGTMGAGHGALAGFLKNAQADVLICGGIGGGAQMAMQEAGIALYGGNMGSADEAVKAFLAQTLVQNENPTCDHHDHEHGEGHSCGDHGCGTHSCGNH